MLNALAAVAVGLERGLKPAEAVAALATLAPADKRGQVLQVGNITVINDCYNSNPKALEAMVDALAAMAAKRRIVVAGEMLELGPAGEEMHRQAGRAHRGEEDRCAARSARAGAGDGRGREEGGNSGRVCGVVRGSWRMVGARGAGWRCGFVEGFARREAGEGAGNLEETRH